MIALRHTLLILCRETELEQAVVVPAVNEQRLRLPLLDPIERREVLELGLLLRIENEARVHRQVQLANLAEDVIRTARSDDCYLA